MKMSIIVFSENLSILYKWFIFQSPFLGGRRIFMGVRFFVQKALPHVAHKLSTIFMYL